MSNPRCDYCAQGVPCLDDACPVRADRRRNMQTLGLRTNDPIENRWQEPHQQRQWTGITINKTEADRERIEFIRRAYLARLGVAKGEDWTAYAGQERGTLHGREALASVLRTNEART